MNIVAFIEQIWRPRLFDFETPLSLERCVRNLRSLEPETGAVIQISWLPILRHEVRVSQRDDHNCYFDIAVKQRSGRGRSWNYVTANASGRLRYDPATKQTRVSGDVRSDSTTLVIGLVAAIGFAIFVIAVGFSTWLLVALLFAVAYMILRRVIDPHNLRQRIHEVLQGTE